MRGVCLPVVQHPVSFNIYKAAAKQSSSQKSGSDLGRGGSAPFEYNIMKTMDLLVTRLCDAVIHQYQEDCIYIYTVRKDFVWRDKRKGLSNGSVQNSTS